MLTAFCEHRDVPEEKFLMEKGTCGSAGAGRLPAGGEEGPGEPEEGPGEEDQDAGVRPEAGEVGVHHSNCTKYQPVTRPRPQNHRDYLGVLSSGPSITG